ncbi:MAG: hypothetical protein ACAH83_15340 [Alphaproteobacteria bacterium]
MTLTLKVNEFGALATSGTLDEAVRETDFMKRAIKLFNLREKVWGAFTSTKEEIEKETEKEADARASVPSWIGASAGFIAGITGLVLFAGVVTPMVGILALGAGLVSGFLTGGVVDAIFRHAPEEEGEEATKLLEYSRKNMSERIETEIERMDSSLFSQKPEIRDEFRSAFKHAATKQEIRESRIHRAKVEQEVEETREAAQSAAAMASMAAATAAMSSMSRR